MAVGGKGREFLLLVFYYLEKRCLDPVPENGGREGFSVLLVMNFLPGMTENPALDDWIWAPIDAPHQDIDKWDQRWGKQQNTSVFFQEANSWCFSCMSTSAGRLFYWQQLVITHRSFSQDGFNTVFVTNSVTHTCGTLGSTQTQHHSCFCSFALTDHRTA